MGRSRRIVCGLCVALFIVSSVFAEPTYKKRYNTETNRGDWVNDTIDATQVNNFPAESDPVFTSHPAHGLTSDDMTDIGNLSGTNTGDQDLSGLVPYTGANANVDLGSYDLTTTGIGTFNNIVETTPTLLKLDQTTPQQITGRFAETGKKVVLNGDLRGVWSSGITTLSIPYTDVGYGITITNILVQSSDADPTTELNANIMYSDAQGTGAFPGANPTLIKAIDTTTGNYDSGAITDSVATGKELYLLLDADPVDVGKTWRIIITYSVKVS